MEDAKRMMQNEEEEANREVDNGGPKIKMNRIGKKSRKPAGGAAAAGAGKGAAASEPWKPAEKSSGGSGGFSEQDIEFMKKAIQVLCQSTNPLGKSIDFVTDDIDSMNKEFEHWRKEASSC